MPTYRRDDDDPRPPSQLSWQVVAIIASLAGGGGGYLGTLTDGRGGQVSPGEVYTVTMARNDRTTLDYKFSIMEKELSKMEDNCERTRELVSALQKEVWKH